MVDVKDGDWFVEHDWKYRVRKAIRITKQMVFYIDETWNNRERRVRLESVFFSCTDRGAAQRVAEKLTSSDALCEQERRAAEDRRAARNEKIIAEAKALEPSNA